MTQRPVISLQPVNRDPDTRVLSYNFDQIVEWMGRMNAYVAELEARIAALEAAP